MRNHIRFLLGDEMRVLNEVDPSMTVLDYLRLSESLVGTKEGCNEGDCGACTVVRVRPDGGYLRYEAVNACIQLLGTLDGCQLVTVEHLAEAGRLHPVQQAMVACHGSQCGFCTPGFVMSLFALRQARDSAPGEQEIDDSLAGNLCRCTGYAPIARAARRMYDLPPAQDRFATKEGETLAALEALEDRETVSVEKEGRRFLAPASVEALGEILLAQPQATLVAGSTDVGLWVTKDLQQPDPVVYLGRITALAEVLETPEGLEIGAAATYSAAQSLLARHYPDMGEVIRRLGSVQIRNVGTLGGNIANGSPIGDSPPLLIAAGATLHLRHGKNRRSLPLEDFFLDYGKQDRQPGEFVEKIVVPIPAAGTRYRAYKVSKRFDQDISALLGAFQLRFEGPRIVAARIAFGGLAATPKRARHAEAALTDAEWTEATLQAAIDALARDFAPISDWRASADYRLRVAGNLLRRCFIETTEPSAGTETRLVGDPALAHV